MFHLGARKTVATEKGLEWTRANVVTNRSGLPVLGRILLRSLRTEFRGEYLSYCTHVRYDSNFAQVEKAQGRLLCKSNSPRSSDLLETDFPEQQSRWALVA